MSEPPDLDRLVARCTFPPPGTPAVAACSGGPDSVALVALAARAGLDVTAVHVHHGLRPDADHDADVARRAADRFGVAFRLEHAHLEDGPNLEARARAARRALLGADAMTGHTADDQAETVLLALVRGAGATGLAGMRPGPNHPLLALRRRDTHEVCRHLGVEVATDHTNRSGRFRRNRIRNEALPLLDDIAERDVTPLLRRAADHLRDDDDLLEHLASAIDPCSVDELRSAAAPLARRALRRWLTVDGYAPDAATIERVLAVVRHDAASCDVGGGRRVSRSSGRLRLD